MAEKTVEERIKQIVVENLGVDDSEVTGNASFADDLGADSLDAVEIIICVEEGFGISIPDEEADEIKTVQQLVDHVTKATEKKKKGK